MEKHFMTIHLILIQSNEVAYDYIKNNYRLIAVDLSQQKELDADPKAIQQTEFVEQLKNVDGINADGAESMFVLIILEKNHRRKEGSVAVL